ncbi:MAG: RsmB/NOP family class I SAM-dependent RNA methyltransferase [Anaeromyxobacter sp.]
MQPLSEDRLRTVPWHALAGLAPALEAPLADVLSGVPAERVLDRLLRDRRGLDAAGRAAVAEAIFGVGLWRRRLRAQLGDPQAGPRLLLGALLRDLAGREDAEALLGLEPGALPPPRPAPVELGDRASFPDWLVVELQAAVGPKAPALADALNLPGPVALRANRLRTDRDALAALLAAEGVATRPSELAPDGLVCTSPRPNVLGLSAHREGLLEVQDEASQLAGSAVGARPGEEVLDLCAGAGGKALLLAAAVGPGGRVHATDADPARLERLLARAERSGCAGAITVHGAAPPPDLRVQRVLVDAPCSELGALRRGPDQRWRIDPASFAALPALQQALLARAATHVAPGGRLVYATCTFRAEEDEAVAEAFEDAHPDFLRIVPDVEHAAVRLGGLGALVTPDGFVRTWPHRHGADGFFVAAWRRERGT